MGLLKIAISENCGFPCTFEEGKSEDQNTLMDNMGTVCIGEG